MLSQFEFLSFIKMWIFKIRKQYESIFFFLSLLEFWDFSQFEFLVQTKFDFFYFGPKLSFWFLVLSWFEFLSFVPIGVVSCHNLSFSVLLQIFVITKYQTTKNLFTIQKILSLLYFQGNKCCSCTQERVNSSQSLKTNKQTDRDRQTDN